MTNVLILYGGLSDEREVSLRSGAAVSAGLETAGYSVEQFDYRGKLPETITADIVFPALHGKGGEDGAIQRQLGATGIPYVGSGVTSSELCFNKRIYKNFLNEHGLPTPNGAVVSIDGFAQSDIARGMFVLKPYDGGSSVDTLIVREAGAFLQATIEQLFSRHETLLLEELIVGTEITVAIIGDQALPVIEIIPPADGEFDYDNKYNGKTQEICPAESIDTDVQIRAQELALEIHTLCGCAGMSRTDMIVRTDGSLVVLETNTIPGLTDQSLLPKAAAAAGYDFPALVDYLIRISLPETADASA